MFLPTSLTVSAVLVGHQPTWYVCHLQLCLLAALSLALAVSCADSQGASTATATATAAAAPLGSYLGCFDLEHVKSLPGLLETGVSVQQVVHQEGLHVQPSHRSWRQIGWGSTGSR
jgi:hypothetical protein